VTSKYSIHPLSFDGISTYPLETRNSKVHAGMFGKAMDGSENILSFISKLPRILAGDQLRTLIRAILHAKSTRKPILWGFGGHVVKVGLGPIIVDLIQNGFVTGIVMNGAAAIHDFEVAFRGSTSEEVEEQIHSGRFGMARETGEFMNAAINAGVNDQIGLGESLGRYIQSHPDFACAALSILGQAYETSVPVTVHVAIGTDIIHIHPNASGANLGTATYQDFQLLCAMVQELHGGGVYLNVGSAVVLPEVFLKAISVVKNLGHPLKEFTTAHLDFIQHYRPTQNVLHRPTQRSGQSVALTGHHEIMIPLIAAAIKGASSGQADA
jgi:hypothetical protein